MILKIAIGVYGGLSIIAAILQGKYKNITAGSAVLLGLGGALMLSTLFVQGYTSVFVLLAGALMAHVSAIINGVKMYGEVNKSHHFARLLISVMLVVSQLMSVKGF